MSVESLEERLFLDTICELRLVSEADKYPSQGRVYELIEPHLLYVTSSQSADYVSLQTQSDYSVGFHRDLIELVTLHSNAFLPSSTESLSLIDLGPGYPDKTLPLLHRAKNCGHSLHYLPVDVSEDYLRIAVQASRGLASEVTPLHCRFEECATRMPEDIYASHLIVFIGLTFMNFEATEILSLLQQIAKGKGKIVVATELIGEANDVSSIVSQYDSDEVAQFTFGPLRNLGVPFHEATYSVGFNDEKHRIEASFVITNEIEGARGQVPFKQGDRVITAVSHRYSIDSFEEAVSSIAGPGTQLFISDNQRTGMALIGAR